MAGRVQSFPLGLQSLLSLKGGGEIPQDLADSIAGVIDLTKMYLLGVREQITSASVAAAIGTPGFPDLTVPLGETWYVWHYSVFCNTGVNTATFGPGIAVQGINVVSLGPQVVGAATTQFLAPASNPFWARSGDELCACVGTSAGPPNISGRVVISRLRS